MKALLKISLVAAIVLGCISCKKDETVIYKSSLQVINIDVPYDSWEYSIAPEEESIPELKYMGNWFKASVTMPEITKDVYDGALVKMYRVFKADGAQMEMPYVRLFEDYDPETTVSHFYTEAIDYEFLQGCINIFYTRSDFVYEDDLQFLPDDGETMYFRCVIAK